MDYQLYCSVIKQQENHLHKQLKKYLKKYYKQVYSAGNYLFAPGDINIALVAHLDTVFKDPPKNIFYDKEKGVIWSPEGGCGDDRAGVYAIIEIIRSGLRPTIIFTRGEESGGIGATELISHFPQCPVDLRYIIQLDRRGFDECVFYQLRNQEFINYISSFGFKKDFGSFSDISILCPHWGIAGTNLSVGYTHEHSTSEYVLIKALDNTINKVKKMLQDNNDIYYDYIADKPEFETETAIKCSKCGGLFDNTNMFPVVVGSNYEMLCPDCLTADPTIQWCDCCYTAFKTVDENDAFCPMCYDKMLPTICYQSDIWGWDNYYGLH